MSAAAGESRAAPWVAAALAVAVAGSTTLALRVRNPDPPLLPAYARVARSLPDGPLGFVSLRPWRKALYRYHAFRYAAAPRPVAFEERRPRSAWVLLDGARAARGYETVASFEAARLHLLRREPGADAGAPSGP